VTKKLNENDAFEFLQIIVVYFDIKPLSV